jgi:hypothetical protein
MSSQLAIPAIFGGVGALTVYVAYERIQASRAFWKDFNHAMDREYYECFEGDPRSKACAEASAAFDRMKAAPRR